LDISHGLNRRFYGPFDNNNAPGRLALYIAIETPPRGWGEEYMPLPFWHYIQPAW
jgi:hypothetical protein